jgi:5-methylcytosine-specific restriction enzyme A
MELVRGNFAIANHVEDGKALLLFEYVAIGEVRFVGECRCIGFHAEDAPDRNGNIRQAIVFELEILVGAHEAESAIPSEPPEPRYWKLSLEELAEVASRTASRDAPTKIRKVITHQRSEAVKILALRRAKGICEGCGNPAPFIDTRSKPFLEVHHLHRRADGGPDLPPNVVAICPNCHRRVHQGRDGVDFNKTLIAIRS